MLSSRPSLPLPAPLAGERGTAQRWVRESGPKFSGTGSSSARLVWRLLPQRQTIFVRDSVRCDQNEVNEPPDAQPPAGDQLQNSESNIAQVKAIHCEVTKKNREEQRSKPALIAISHLWRATFCACRRQRGQFRAAGLAESRPLPGTSSAGETNICLRGNRAPAMPAVSCATAGLRTSCALRRPFVRTGTCGASGRRSICLLRPAFAAKANPVGNR